MNVSAHLRIGGALAMGLVLVLGAFVLSKQGVATGEAAGAVVSAAPERSYIQIADANGDGIEDWKEALPSDSIELPSIATTSEPLPYTPPTTFTGKFAQAFFTDYLSARNGTDKVENPQELITNALTAIDTQAHEKELFTAADIHTVSDTPDSIRTYGNALAAILNQDAVVTDINAILPTFQLSVETQDPTQLVDIRHTLDLYKQNMKAALSIPVPRSLVREHLTLLNTARQIQTNIEALLSAYNDPLLALAHIQRYGQDITALSASIRGIGTKIISTDVQYAPTEPGSFFYTFSL